MSYTKNLLQDICPVFYSWQEIYPTGKEVHPDDRELWAEKLYLMGTHTSPTDGLACQGSGLTPMLLLDDWFI